MFSKTLSYLLLLVMPFSFLKAQPYNYYFGNLHAHSSYSDGNQDAATSGASTPAQDYAYAKLSYHMDFLGISEHNHYQAGMTAPSFYHSGVTEASAANSDGIFVSLYGMEWGVISGGGHVLVYGIDSLVGWDKQADGITNDYDIYCAKNDYSSLWNIVNARTGAFCTLAHPNNTDYSNLLTTYSSTGNQAISGCAFRSGSAFSTTTDYTDGAPTSYESYYKQLLSRGYHAAPLLDADNHNTTFGRTHKGRTVVLANSLTKANLLSALRNRRFYASDDWNAQLTFTVSGHYMGSIVNTYDNSTISVSVSDPDAGDNVSSIQILCGVPGSGTNATVLSSNTSSSTLSYTHTTAVGNQFYYYARIVQTDGNVILSAPVWISRENYVLPADGFLFEAKERNGKAELKWETLVNNSTLFTIEKSFGGSNFFSIGTAEYNGNDQTKKLNYNYTDSNTVNGTQFYRIRETDLAGNNKYSSILAVMIRKPMIKLIRLFPVPAKEKISITFSAAVTGEADCIVYSQNGLQVLKQKIRLTEGTQYLTIDTHTLAAGLYYLVIRQPNERLLETKFVKQ